MASLSAIEDEYNFVEKPSEDFYCPVTFELLREPHQTTCCGNHLSRQAVTRLQGQPCPMCKESNLNTMPDKYFKRRIDELKVHCPNKSLGCEWVGELGSLYRHLSQNSVEGECQFVTVACPYDCSRSFKRRRLMNHKAMDCLSRPFTCQYCNYKAAYTKVTNEHWAICKKYPMECPNRCGESVIERQHLSKHLEETCPLHVIKCDFSYAGCEVECQRQHMQTHLDENIKVHLNKVSVALQSKTEQQQSINEQLQNVIEQQQKQIVALTYLNVQKPLVPVFVPPPDIVMTNFGEHKKADGWWYSPPFYSHIGGYKICLCVIANGYCDGKATHVSVFCNLNRGEYDDQLKWPFRGDITIQLLNQSSDEGYREKTVPFDDSVGDDIAGRVVRMEKAAGRGYYEFIAHNQLNTENREYLKNDCLKLRISNIRVKSI